MAKPTLTREQVLPETLALAEEIRDVCRTEELWSVIQRHLMAFSDTQEAPYTFGRLQAEAGIWQEKNFGAQPAYRNLLGVSEEVGELAHAHLKGEQGIRLTPEEVRAKKIDAVGDIVIFLANYCTSSGIDFQKAVEITWAEARKRVWNAKKEAGPGMLGLVTEEN